MPDAPTFSDTFFALHGYEPFPWQAALADRVADSGWVDINAPTGCGKTSVIDVWLYDLARRAMSGEPIKHRRLVYVVDRRIVVDGTYRHAVDISSRIADAVEGPLHIIGQGLRGLADEKVPVLVARMRGGSWRDESWASNPAQPIILVSTVDQAGSRLLGRGYGCGRSLQVVSAALLGNDALWLVDEAPSSFCRCETNRYGRLTGVRCEPRTPRPWRIRFPNGWLMVALFQNLNTTLSNGP
jgi:CRISPR-associated endonuclease/helicase Cas3